MERRETDKYKQWQETYNMNDDQIQNMLYHILQMCKNEADSKQLAVPLNNFVKRVSHYTQIPEYQLQKLYNKKIAQDPDTEKFVEIDTQIKIYKMIIKFYSEKQMPTYESLFESLKSDETFNDFEKFKHKLAIMGLRYKTIINDSELLVEPPYIIMDRYQYLRNMRKFRVRKAHIYYVDERLIDENLTFKKPWKNSIDVKNEISKYLMFYAISKDGYKNSLFCNQATPEDFANWVVNILLPQLEPSSVVVLDNSPLHGTIRSTTNYMYRTKQEMLQWLLNNDVPHSKKMSKAELYDLITLSSPEENIPSLDRIIKANGHKVLRLPTNLLKLSPVHLMWEEVKTSLLTLLLDPLLYETKDEIHAQLLAMPNGKFKEFDQKIDSWENQLLVIEADLEKANDKVMKEVQRLNNCTPGIKMEINEEPLNTTEDIAE